ncbi:hypothetical protein [Pontimicrobium sp. IMCC45349]|jgi:membrane-bound ClpP family serine protease|uniref:hypothetical protein n=1 Tax=Pontimicrobium sp. IMCC45349 TaxID=3391574 RepID=UPI0039A16725
MKGINYFLILIGAAVAIYADAQEQQNAYILIGGIIVLAFGLFRLSSTIPNRKEEDEEFVKTEKDEE